MNENYRNQFAALFNGWTVSKVSLYDEEGVEGWKWESPAGNEYCEIGDWHELPTWPDSATSELNVGCRTRLHAHEIRAGF